MKKIISLIVCILPLICAGAPAKPSEKILIAGSGWNKIMLIDKASGKSDWTYEIPKHVECNSVVYTKDKNIFYANKKNARLINTKEDIIWEFTAKQDEEIHTAIELKNGILMLAISGKPARFVELYPKDGKVIKEVSFDTGIDNIHGQFRQATKTKKGNYLVSLLGRQIVVEINAKGEFVREMKTGFPVFSTKELNDGTWLISGDGGNIAILNPDKKEVVRRINNKNLEDAKLLFATEAVQLKNGNIMVSNWNGHSDDKTQPKLMEINKDNKIVWKLQTQENIKDISAFFVLSR